MPRQGEVATRQTVQWAELCLVKWQRRCPFLTFSLFNISKRQPLPASKTHILPALPNHTGLRIPGPTASKQTLVLLFCMRVCARTYVRVFLSLPKAVHTQHGFYFWLEMPSPTCHVSWSCVCQDAAEDFDRKDVLFPLNCSPVVCLSLSIWKPLTSLRNSGNLWLETVHLWLRSQASWLGRAEQRELEWTDDLRRGESLLSGMFSSTEISRDFYGVILDLLLPLFPGILRNCIIIRSTCLSTPCKSLGF